VSGTRPGARINNSRFLIASVSGAAQFGCAAFFLNFGCGLLYFSQFETERQIHCSEAAAKPLRYVKRR
jgi:hypothetical protein